MVVAEALLAMLGLSCVSDYVRRCIAKHAVHLDPHVLTERTQRPWIEWGTVRRGDLIRRPSGEVSTYGEPIMETVEFVPWFVTFRVPGVYWEPVYNYLNDRPAELGWHHHFYRYEQRSPVDARRGGWRDAFLPCD